MIVLTPNQIDKLDELRRKRDLRYYNKLKITKQRKIERDRIMNQRVQSLYF